MSDPRHPPALRNKSGRRNNPNLGQFLVPVRPLLVKHRLPSLAWRAHTHAQLTEAIRQPRVDRAHGALRLSPMPWLFPPRLPCPLVASSSARPKHDSVLRVAGTSITCA